MYLSSTIVKVSIISALISFTFRTLLIGIVYQKKRERRGQCEERTRRRNRIKEEKKDLIFLDFFYLARIYVDGIKINWPLTPRHCDTLEEKERGR